MNEGLLTDTSEATSRVQLELIRSATPERRLEACFRLSRSMIALSRACLRDRFPELGDHELSLKWVELQYGTELAAAVRARMAGRTLIPHDEISEALGPVVAAFDQLGVAWYVGGSVASSAFGQFRATNDVDIVADLKPEHAEPLVTTLGEAFYADLDAIHSAIRRRGSFNAVHYGTMLKIDVFVLRSRPYDLEALRRRVSRPMSTVPGSPCLYLASPEDVVLSKLDWYRRGGGASDRQWTDVQGGLRVQSSAMDAAYLRRWSSELGLLDLLERALAEAGLT